MALQTMYPGQPNSPQTELASAIDDEQTTIPLLDASVLPDPPNICTIGTGEGAETVLYTGKSGNNLTGVARGFQGAAKAWVQGTKVARNFTAYDYDALRQNVADHVAATTGVHGATSAATPNTIVQRDAQGRIKAAAPSAADDVARKAEVDAITTEIINTTTYKTASEPGSSYPIGITTFSVTNGVADGWPVDGGVVLTIRLSNVRCLQIFSGSHASNVTNGRLFNRSWRNDAGWSVWRRQWDSQEMGAGSGLDADLLDGLHASSFWTKSEIPYETGTWTPELWFGSSNSGITYSMRTGRYTRIGNIVYFTFRLDLTSKGSASGVASITGLPFTSMSGNEHAAFAIGMLNPINMPSNAFWVHGIILNSSNQILIRASGNLEGSISLNASNFSDNTAIRAEGFYFIP